MDIFDKKQISDLLATMIVEECDRIVARKIATSSQVSRYVLGRANRVAHETEEVKLHELSDLYSVLEKMQLPGDADSVIVIDIGDVDAPAVLSEESIESDVGVCKNEGEVEECEECEGENKDDVECEGKECDGEDEANIEAAISLINKLKKVAYNFGSSGDHESAYRTERMIKTIENMLIK